MVPQILPVNFIPTGYKKIKQVRKFAEFGSNPTKYLYIQGVGKILY